MIKNEIGLLFLVLPIVVLSQTNSYPPSGNVGVGTINPSGKLEILKNADLSSSISLPDSGFVIRADNDGNDATMRFGVDNSNLKALIQTQQTSSGTKFDLLFNPFGGNVGIGTTSSLSKLTVSNGSPGGTHHGFSDVTIEDDAEAMINLLSPSGYTGYYGFSDENDSYVGGIQYNHSTNSMSFRVNDHATGDIYINQDSNVGIGTTSPVAKLHVSSETSGDAILRLEADTDNNNESDNPEINFSQDGGLVNYFIGIEGNSNTKSTGTLDNALVIGTESNRDIQIVNDDEVQMTIKSTGVGIGTTAPDAKLTVKGDIHTEEVKVDLSVPGPDYVFKKDYNLKSLEEVQNYIKTNGHLPNIPSAQEMEANGIQLGEMNMKLLEKIEELMLYTLEQEKQLNDRNKQLNELRSSFLKLEERIKILEKK